MLENLILCNARLKMNFKDRKINEIFRGTISKGSGIYHNDEQYKIYRKIDKSHAIIINEIGYHNNNRGVGHIECFAPYTQTWDVTK